MRSFPGTSRVGRAERSIAGISRRRGGDSLVKPPGPPQLIIIASRQEPEDNDGSGPAGRENLAAVPAVHHGRFLVPSGRTGGSYEEAQPNVASSSSVGQHAAGSRNLNADQNSIGRRKSERAAHQFSPSDGIKGTSTAGRGFRAAAANWSRSSPQSLTSSPPSRKDFRGRNWRAAKRRFSKTAQFS